MVDCPACGITVERRDAREYDRFGDRWDRTGKTFEYLCKPCHRMMCQVPRTELEELLIAVGSHPSHGEFLAAYYRELRTRHRH